MVLILQIDHVLSLIAALVLQCIYNNACSKSITNQKFDYQFVYYLCSVVNVYALSLA